MEGPKPECNGDYTTYAAASIAMVRQGSLEWVHFSPLHTSLDYRATVHFSEKLLIYDLTTKKKNHLTVKTNALQTCPIPLRKVD
jgi:hypothetical protein